MTTMPPADPRIEAVAARLKEAAQKRAEAYAPPTDWQPIWKRPRKPKSIKAKKEEMARQRKRLKAAGVRRFYGAQAPVWRPERGDGGHRGVLVLMAGVGSPACKACGSTDLVRRSGPS